MHSVGRFWRQRGLPPLKHWHTKGRDLDNMPLTHTVCVNYPSTNLIEMMKLPGNASDPNTSYDNLLPVIFWVHGGAFSVGEAPTYSIDKYMDRDVVLVSVQYRLGPFGFMSLNTDEIPGNAGIFDQIEALRWVNKFIKYFGGDPDCVTIAGQSAGSASVSALMLAPQARGKAARFTASFEKKRTYQKSFVSSRALSPRHRSERINFESMGHRSRSSRTCNENRQTGWLSSGTVQRPALLLAQCSVQRPHLGLRYIRG